MFSGVHAYAVGVTVTTDRMNAATTRAAVAIYGEAIAAVSAWDCSRNGDKSMDERETLNKGTNNNLNIKHYTHAHK